MDRAAIEPAIRLILTEMRQRLEQATGIAKSAEVCVQAGNLAKGVEIALDVEQLCYEASRLLDSASLLSRLSRETS
jgi:hypothetical protein